MKMFASFQRAMSPEVLSLDIDGSIDPSNLGPWKNDAPHCAQNLKLTMLANLFLHKTQHMDM